MLVRFARSGGFGGMRVSRAVDTGTLTPGEAKNVTALVESASFFSLPETFPRPSKGADFFTYTITVEDGGRNHTIEVCEPAAPPTLIPLIRYLAKRGEK